jgi:hypothetical protein
MLLCTKRNIAEAPAAVGPLQVENHRFGRADMLQLFQPGEDLEAPVQQELLVAVPVKLGEDQRFTLV